MAGVKGIVRQMDEVGRVVLPKEFREVLNLSTKDSIEMILTEDGIMLKKYNPGCEWCGSLFGLRIYHGHRICSECQKEVREDR